LGFIIELLPLWFNLKYGVSGDFLGVWYALGNALSLVSVYLVPKLTQRFGTAWSLMLTQGVGTFFLVAMIVAPTAFLAAVLFLIRQFLMNLSWPVQQSHLQAVVAPEERGAGNSLVFGTWGLANSLSPTLGGEWLRQGFLSLPLLAASASYVLSVALFYVMFRRAKTR
jgi:predicted MFS family arabinose efflux permease